MGCLVYVNYEWSACKTGHRDRARLEDAILRQHQLSQRRNTGATTLQLRECDTPHSLWSNAENGLPWLLCSGTHPCITVKTQFPLRGSTLEVRTQKIAIIDREFWELPLVQNNPLQSSTQYTACRVHLLGRFSAWRLMLLQMWYWNAHETLLTMVDPNNTNPLRKLFYQNKKRSPEYISQTLCREAGNLVPDRTYCVWSTEFETDFEHYVLWNRLIW